MSKRIQKRTRATRLAAIIAALALVMGLLPIEAFAGIAQPIDDNQLEATDDLSQPVNNEDNGTVEAVGRTNAGDDTAPGTQTLGNNASETNALNGEEEDLAGNDDNTPEGAESSGQDTIKPAQASANESAPNTEGDEGAIAAPPISNIVKNQMKTVLSSANILGTNAVDDADNNGDDQQSPTLEPQANPRVYLSATTGGSISGQGASSGGAQKAFTISAGSTQELTEDNCGNAPYTITANPESGYTFVGWYTQWNSTSPTQVSTSATYTYNPSTSETLTASFKASTSTDVTSATIMVTPPSGGSSGISAASRVSVPSGAGYHVASAAWTESATISSNYNDPAETNPGRFVTGKSYYMLVTLEPNDGYRLLQGGELGSGSSPTQLTVTGGTSTYSDLMVTNYTLSDGSHGQYGKAYITVTVPTDTYIDNTEDKSVSYVTGFVHLTGSGGTQAGYNPGTTVYNADASVTYSNPKTAEVQGRINDAYTKVYNLANACKKNGKTGEFHMSTSETTGRVWDNRKYKTYECQKVGDTFMYVYNNDLNDTIEIFDPSTATVGDRIHIASGDYGKETFYRVEANGYVRGYDIAVTDDGYGTGTASPVQSLAGQIVTLTATPSAGKAFVRWVVIAGDALLADAAAAVTTFTMPAADVEVKAEFHEHQLTKTEQVEPTCTGAGTEAYWTCSECGRLFSDAAATTEIAKPIAIDVLGHDWGEWIVDKEATELEAGLQHRVCKRDSSHVETQVIDKIVVEYHNVEGSGLVRYDSSSDDAVFVFKRNVNDATTFSHFTGVQMDGATVNPSNYTAVAGSVVITFKGEYMKTLPPGNHTVTALFDDGTATADFTIQSTAEPLKDAKTIAPTSATPATGDPLMPVGVLALIIAAAGSLALLAQRMTRGSN